MGKRLTATTVAQHEVGVGDSIVLGKTLTGGFDWTGLESLRAAPSLSIKPYPTDPALQGRRMR